VKFEKEVGHLANLERETPAWDTALLRKLFCSFYVAERAPGAFRFAPRAPRAYFVQSAGNSSRPFAWGEE
jgi:hypothetical protein